MVGILLEKLKLKNLIQSKYWFNDETSRLLFKATNSYTCLTTFINWLAHFKGTWLMHPDDVKISLERNTLICQARILTWLTRRVSPV